MAPIAKTRYIFRMRTIRNSFPPTPRIGRRASTASLLEGTLVSRGALLLGVLVLVDQCRQGCQRRVGPDVSRHVRRKQRADILLLFRCIPWLSAIVHLLASRGIVDVLRAVRGLYIHREPGASSRRWPEHDRTNVGAGYTIRLTDAHSRVHGRRLIDFDGHEDRSPILSRRLPPKLVLAATPTIHQQIALGSCLQGSTSSNPCLPPQEPLPRRFHAASDLHEG